MICLFDIFRIRQGDDVPSCYEALPIFRMTMNLDNAVRPFQPREAGEKLP